MAQPRVVSSTVVFGCVAGRRDARAVVLEDEVLADVEDRRSRVAVLVGDRRGQCDQVVGRQRRDCRPGRLRSGDADRPDLVERDIAGGIDADREHQVVAAAVRPSTTPTVDRQVDRLPVAVSIRPEAPAITPSA